jgi:membrane-associated protease RseP (regulator of RpoE activity)
MAKFKLFTKDSYTKYILLFVLTFITCTMAGVQWSGKEYLDINNWHIGLTYSILILTFLGVHEFGHYFAAKYHNVHTSLPYFIPFPVPFFFINFGTFGAIIRMRQAIPSRKALFDIGIAGPIAGYLVSIIILIIGLINLPTKEMILEIHPEYILNYSGTIPSIGFHYGDTMLYSFLQYILVPTGKFMPPMNEIYHFPFLNVGWFGLFVTTMNLLPIGQFDGGHIFYAMFGKKAQLVIAKVSFWFLAIIGLFGTFNDIYVFLQDDYGFKIISWLQNLINTNLAYLYEHIPILRQFWSGWLLWALIGRFAIKLQHPPTQDETPINRKRMILGWLAVIMLISSFSFNAIYFL